MYSRTKIHPVVDVPLIMQLESVVGAEANSKYNGLEYRYEVVYDNQPALIYLNESGRDAIVYAQAQPGDYIELLKSKDRGQFVYSVQVVSDAGEPEAPPQPQRPPTRMLPPARQPQYTQAAQPPHRPRTPSPQRPPQQYQPQPRAQAQPPRPEASDVSASAQQMAGCLRLAFDAWEELRQYAQQKGVNLDYTSEDVRAVGLSWFIQVAGGRR